MQKVDLKTLKSHLTKQAAMKNKVTFLLICLFSIAAIAEENKDPKLENLIVEIRLADLNRAKADLPDGLHSVRGYISSGLFYPCSLKHGLHIFDNKEREKLMHSEQRVYVEFTASFFSGAIYVVEVHSISDQPLSACEFRG